MQLGGWWLSGTRLALCVCALLIASAQAQSVTRTPDAAPGAEQARAWGPLGLLGGTIAVGTRANLHWIAGQSFSGLPLRAPVIAIRGGLPGPTLCLTAAVHGDELNGIEIVRRVMADVDPQQLAGTLIGVPIVNLLGFSQGSRYLPDRSDLNRYFPGHPGGNSAARIAHSFFEDVVRHCGHLVDLHTGSFKRSNLPQLRANLDLPAVAEFITHFGGIAVLHNARERGTLRYAATGANVPAVTLELGEPGTVQTEHVRYGVKAILTLLDGLHMLERFQLWSEPMRIFRRSRWLRAYHGGILNSSIVLGAAVSEGQLLGRIINPLTNEASEIRAPFAGLVLGRALNQFVLPGYATFHLGRDADARITDSATPAEPESTPDDEEEPPAGRGLALEPATSARQDASAR